MKLYIYNLSKTLHEGESYSVTLPTEDGEISVLDHHIPLTTTLKKGVVTVREKNETKKYEVGGGVAYTDGAQLVVLAD